MATIATRSIDQLQEADIEELKSQSENSNMIISIDNEARKISPATMKSYFGSSGGSSNSDSTGDNEETVSFSNQINSYNVNTYFKTYQCTQGDDFEVTETDLSFNIHCFAVFPSAGTAIKPNKLVLYIWTNNKNGGHQPICKKYTLANTAELDVHLRAGVGVQFRIRAYQGETKISDNNSVIMDITAIRANQKFMSNSKSFLVTIPLKEYGNTGGLAVTLPDYYGRIKTSACVSINTPSQAWDYGNNIHITSKFDDSSTPNPGQSDQKYYNLDTVSVEKASTKYNIVFNDILTYPKQVINVCMSGSSMDKSASTANAPNTFTIHFDTIDELNGSDSTDENSDSTNNNKNMLSTIQQVNTFFDNPDNLGHFTRLRYTLDNLKTKSIKDTYKVNLDANSVSNLIGLRHATPLDPTEKTYVRFSDICNNKIVHVYNELNESDPIMWTPSHNNLSSISGTYYIDITDNLQKISISQFKTPTTFSPNLRQIDFGPNITELSDNCFLSCTNLRQLNNLGSITTIGSYQTFKNCSRLRRLDLPTSITSFNNLCATFSNCGYLSSINLSAISVCTEINSLAFENCTSLSSIDLRNIDHITMSASAADPFKGCSALTAIVFDYQNLYKKWESDSYMINKNAFSSINAKNDCKIYIINCPNSLPTETFNDLINFQIKHVAKFLSLKLTCYGWELSNMNEFNGSNIRGASFTYKVQ